MTPQELDSIRKLPTNKDTFNLPAARKMGIGTTTGEIVSQLAQDYLLAAGFPLNLNTFGQPLACVRQHCPSSSSIPSL